MLSTTTEYALRAVVWLAAQGGDARTTDQISQATDVPAPYLSKVLQTLAKAGIVRSQRGLRGGFALQGSPEQVTVLQVVNSVDPVRRIDSCPLKLNTHRDGLCPLHARLDAAAATIEDAFRTCTIEDLFDVPDPRSPLCAAVRDPGSTGDEGEPGTEDPQ